MTPRPPRLTALGTAATLLVGGLLAAVPAAQAAGDAPAATPAMAAAGRTAPAITPTPQSVKPRTDRITISPTVTLVAGNTSDESALQVVESALRRAGAHRVVRADRPARNGLTVHVGDSAALAAQRIEGPDALPADGYVLGIGAGRIVLAGKDTTGTYYAAQTLRQILPDAGHPEPASPGSPCATGPAPRCAASSRGSTARRGRTRPASTSSTTTASTR